MTKKQALTAGILTELSAPFPENEIGWKAQALYPKDKPTTALAVPHITSRMVMNRLDEVVGPASWHTDFEFIPGIKAAKIYLTVLGITKCDIGFIAGDDDAAIKGSVSDGLKRAAVLFGIGRYLYETETQWVAWDNQRRQFAEKPQLKLKNSQTLAEPKKAEKAQKATPPEGIPPEDKPVKVTIGLIQEEANAQLEAMNLEPHYESRVQTIRAMEACGYKGTALDYLTENFSDIVACLIDRVKEKEEA